MKVVKTNLMSKNSRKNKLYLYRPIVEMGGKYFWCESIKTKSVVRKFDLNDLQITRQVPDNVLKAHGIIEY